MTSRFHPAMRVEAELYGDAILTPHPERLIRADALPTVRGIPGLEPRGALWSEIMIDGAAVNVLNTHLGDQQIVLAEDAGRIASTGDAEHDHSGGEGIAAKPIRQGRRELRHHGPLQRPLLDNEALVGISLARQGLHPRRQRLGPSVAQDGHLHLIIGRAGADAVVQPALVIDLLAVDRRDHVALTHPRTGQPLTIQVDPPADFQALQRWLTTRYGRKAYPSQA